MNRIEKIKHDIKNNRHNYKKNNSKVKYVNNLISRLILSVIVFLCSLILINYNNKVRTYVKDKVLGENISFTKISNTIKKYLGFSLPIDTDLEVRTVFNEKIVASSVEPYKDGYSLNVGTHYLIPVINSGIVAFIGEKEGLGPTVIIEGVDEIEYWYGGLENISVNLYDYVSASTLLGNTQGDKLYLLFKKDGEYLDYEEVME